MAPSSTQVSVVGPPELYQKPIPASDTTTTEKIDPEINNNLMGLTENGSETFLSSGNPCLDFFFHVVPNTPPQTLTQRLELAWNHDPLKTLKLICNLRGVRSTGKSDKEGGYTAELWLHKFHPKTLACNVASFAEFGYFKDLLEILFRLLEGPDARKKAVQEYQNWKQAKAMKEYEREQRKQMKETMNGGRGRIGGRRGGYRAGGMVGGLFGRGGHGGTDMCKKNNGPNLSHEEKRIKRAKKVVDRFSQDPDFKFLHERVSDYFAGCLRSDMKMLEGGSNKISLAAKWCPSLDSAYDQTTLLCEPIAKKVFPRDEYPEYEGVEEAHYAYRVRDRLRKQVLVPLRKALELPEVYMGASDWGSIPYGRVASVAMKTLQGKFLEHDEGRFIEYLDQVSMGKAKIAAGALLPHDIIKSLKSYGGKVAELQWKRMVDDMAKKGKLNNCMAICDVSDSMSGIPMEVSVALGVLVSELSDEPWKGKLITFSEYPELQTVVGNSLKEKTEFVRNMEWGGNTDFQKVFDLLLQVAVNGKLKPEQMIKRLFVFSDMEFDQASGVSRYGYSYNGGYAYNQQNQNGYHGSYGYNQNPNPYPYYGPYYGPYYCPYYGPNYGYNQNPNGYNGGYAYNQNPNTYPYYGGYVYNQNQNGYIGGYGYNQNQPQNGGYGYNQNQNQWETDFQVIVKKFTEKGYGDCVPEIVFWNLRDSKATPVPAKQPGVALVSGFSKNLMTLFLEEGGVVGPESVYEEEGGVVGPEAVTEDTVMDPETVMEAAIAGEEYQKLVVMD